MAGRTKRLVDWEKGSANTTDGCLCLPETPSFRSAVIDHHAASIATVHCVHLLGYAQILTLVSYAALFSLSIHFSPHFFICFVFPAFLSSLSRFNKYFRRFSLVFIFPYPIHPAGRRACLRPLRLPATPCAARRRGPIKKAAVSRGFALPISLFLFHLANQLVIGLFIFIKDPCAVLGVVFLRRVFGFVPHF